MKRRMRKKMELRCKKMLIVILVVMMFPLYCMAEDESKESVRLDDVVVSASRTEMSTLTPPRAYPSFPMRRSWLRHLKESKIF